MRKIVIIILALVVALGALPVTFACYNGGWGNWHYFWRPHRTIVYCCPNECNVIFDYDSVYAYDNEEDFTPIKEVAQTTASIQDCGKKLDITITNAYPGYVGTIDFCIKNIGIYPATVNGFTVDKSDPFYAQIAFTGDFLDGTPIQHCETKCGQLVIHSIPQSEEAQKKTFTFTINIDFLCFPTDCDTAYAYHCCYAKCFSYYNFSDWGWTNGQLQPGYYCLSLYAGAGSCNPFDGKKVGWLTVYYNGSTAIVTYKMFYGYKMTETHLYVGSDPLPSENGGYTVDPEQYPFKHENLNNASTDQYTVTDLSGNIYIVAHAEVCR